MCRMFGIVAETPRALVEPLSQAPRSLRALSREHPDGWGIAIRTGEDWRVERSVSCAAACERYEQVARIETRLIVAHVRKKTVGCTSIANTHPFQRGDFVFAHNGTVTNPAALVASPAQLSRIEGQTDSERLFAFVLTQIDDVGDIERGVTSAVHALHALGEIGSASFLLSCGSRIYAHRLGRSLVTSTRDGAVMVASEPLTTDTWTEVPERGLVVLDASDPAHGIELLAA